MKLRRNKVSLFTKIDLEDRPEKIFYKVRKGDTIHNLGVRFQCRKEAILKINGVKSICVEQTLVIPRTIINELGA